MLSRKMWLCILLLLFSWIPNAQAVTLQQMFEKQQEKLVIDLDNIIYAMKEDKLDIPDYNVVIVRLDSAIKPITEYPPLKEATHVRYVVAVNFSTKQVQTLYFMLYRPNEAGNETIIVLRPVVEPWNDKQWPGLASYVESRYPKK